MLYSRNWLHKLTMFVAVIGFAGSLVACNRQSQSGTGSSKTIRVSVGEIKDVSIPARGDNSMELIGTSDNQEIVEVSRQQLAPAVDTLKRTGEGPAVFQIKGVTTGTATVIFSTKPMNAVGSGQPVRTYTVHVK